MQPASDLRIERLRVGVSSSEIAKALRVSTSLVTYWERGERRISDEKREKIRKYLLSKATLR